MAREGRKVAGRRSDRSGKCGRSDYIGDDAGWHNDTARAGPVYTGASKSGAKTPIVCRESELRPILDK